jgi:AcrR family transcriptional regulator
MARPASDISERIVHAARQRFLIEGVDGATLRKIAEDAGTSVGMIYYYFKTKDELFLSVVDEVYSKLLADFKQALCATVPAPERLRLLYLRMAHMNEVEMDIVRLLLREALLSSARLRQVADRFHHGQLPLMVQALQEGAHEGSLRGDLHPAVSLVASFVLAILPPLAHRLVSESGLSVAETLPAPDTAALSLLQVLLEGLRAPAAPAA